MKQHQWGFAPRIGIAWTPFTKLTVRTGYGIYYDRGELFSYLSPSAGSGFNGPFGVTLAPPFVEPISLRRMRALIAAVRHARHRHRPVTGAGFLALFAQPGRKPHAVFLDAGRRATSLAPSCLAVMTSTTNCLTRRTGPSTFNTSSPTTGCSRSDTWAITAHMRCCPFPSTSRSSPRPRSPVNGQIYSYGGTSPLFLDLEPIFTNEFSGNAPDPRALSRL